MSAASSQSYDSITIVVPDLTLLHNVPGAVPLIVLFKLPSAGAATATCNLSEAKNQWEIQVYMNLCEPNSALCQALISNGVRITRHRLPAVQLPIIDTAAVASSSRSWRIPLLPSLTIVDLMIRIWEICITFSNLIHFGPLLTLFQSSGWGKSRSIEGLAKTKLCDILYLCCREGGSGYPTRSRLFDKLLNKMKSLATDSEQVFDWKLFAPALYAVASSLYSVLLHLNVDVASTEYILTDGSTENVIQFENGMCQQYDVFANLSYDDALAQLCRLHGLFSAKHFNSDFNRQLRKVLRDSPDSYDAFLINMWLDKFESMKNRPFRPVVFVFDEARTLSRTSILTGYSLYRVIRHILRETPRNNLDLVAILMDTSSTITDLAPTDKEDPSYRIEVANLTHFRPVCDMFTVDLHFDDGRSLEPFDRRRLFSLGRPLWHAFMRGVEQNIDPVLPTVLLAQRKLFCGRDAFQSSNLPMCISLLASRMSLSFVRRSELNESLVANHMAYCRYISRRCDWIQICYQSEPVLVEAATRQWYLNYPSQLLAMIEHLRSAVDEKQLARGDKGEDVTKLLLLLARDKKSTVRHALAMRDGFFYSDPITVREFLTTFAGFIQNLDEIPKSLLGGLVSFTHFVQLESKANKNLWCRLWRRHAAMQAPAGTPGYDLGIPVKISIGNRDYITYILIQVKNYSETTAENNLDEAMIHKMSRAYSFPKVEDDLADNDTPYLCIYLQLGPHRPTRPIINVVRYRDEGRPTGQYCLYMSGLTTDVYPCLFQNIDKNENSQRPARVEQIVTELQMLLYSIREPLYADVHETDDMKVLKRVRKSIPLILDTADGIRGSSVSRQVKYPVRVVREQ